MAHIQDRGRKVPVKSRYRSRYRAPDGRERSKCFARKIDAERFLSTVESSKLRGDWIDPALGKTRFDEWACAWLESVRPTLKRSTVASYESLLRSRIVPSFGRYRLSSLRPSEIQAWIGDMEAEGLSPSRIRQAHVVVCQVLDAAARDGLVARNAAHGLKLPRVQRREADYFEPSEIERIAEAMPEPYDLLVRVLGKLGLRWGEAAALQRRNVDLLRRRLRVEESLAEIGGRLSVGPTKSHATRSVPLTPSLAKALERHLALHVGATPDASVFTGPQGGPLRHSAFYSRLWRPTLRRLGLPAVGIHVTRHSAAAGMVSAGATPKAVQSVMGHASAAFSLTVYGHLFDADLDALAERLDGQNGGFSNVSRHVRGMDGSDDGNRGVAHVADLRL
jgi:integrase